MKSENPPIPLPKSWPTHVRAAILHVISLAQFATAYTRSWSANSIHSRIRLQAQRDRAVQELALLREEIRIKDARMASINPHRRPHYPPAERLAILELKAARGWSLEQTARVFHITAPTIASWLGRLDEEGPDALVQTRTPVNRFPDFVRYAVQRLKTLCPTMGKVKIAQTLARAGLHLGATTVGRMLREDATPKPRPERMRTIHGTGRNRKAPQQCLAYRPDGRAHRSGLLGSLAAVCGNAAVPILLVGWRRCGSLQPPCDGDRCVRQPSHAATVLCVLGTNHPSEREAEVHRLRPRQHLRLSRVPTLGQTQRDQAATLRQGRQAREHRCRRTPHTVA